MGIKEVKENKTFDENLEEFDEDELFDGLTSTEK